MLCLSMYAIRSITAVKLIQIIKSNAVKRLVQLNYLAYSGVNEFMIKELLGYFLLDSPNFITDIFEI